jgi:predicted RecB family nuclease
MRLTATDFTTYYRPTPCEARVVFRHRGDSEAEPSAFHLVLERLGRTHEQNHLASLGPSLDLSDMPETQRADKTIAAIRDKAPLIYQGLFRATTTLDATEVEIIGIPDFIIRGNGDYFVRDAKMARRIDGENHPEIALQVGLYGWLYEQATMRPPERLQVFSGTETLVDIAYDGGRAALEALTHILRLKQLKAEPYEPVGWSKCNGCGYFKQCWYTAEAARDVALIPDVDQSLARTLHNAGVASRTDLLASYDAGSLAELKRPVGPRMSKVGKKAERILLVADLMEREQEKVLSVPAVPTPPNCVMFDLEGMPPHLTELDKIYLWGMQVFGEKPSEFLPAIADFGPDGDKAGWFAFLCGAKKIFDAYGNIPFIHWAPYEKTYVSKYLSRYGDVDGIAARVKSNLVDLLTIAKDSIALPLPTFSLKVIEKYVGYKRTQEEYGGDWAIAMFIEATETNDEKKRKEVMDQILAYNREDLGAMWAVLQWLRAKRP